MERLQPKMNDKKKIVLDILRDNKAPLRLLFPSVRPGRCYLSIFAFRTKDKLKIKIVNDFEFGAKLAVFVCKLEQAIKVCSLG